MTEQTMQAPAPATPAESAAAHPQSEVTKWEAFSFASMRLFLGGLLRIVGLGGLYHLSRGFGGLEYLIDYKRRRRVGKMQSIVFDESTPKRVRRKWVCENFMRLRCDKVFYLIFDKLPKERLADCFEIVNRDILDAALARGKGVYAMTSHIGSGHVIGMLMSFMGYRVSGVRSPKEGNIRRYMQSKWAEKYPDHPPITLLYTGHFPRPIYRLFKDNFILGSSSDVSKIPDEKMRTIPVKLFGHELEFLLGPLLIAIRCKAAVLQSFTLSSPGFKYRVEFLGPLTDPDSGDESPELLGKVMQQYADNIAEYARRYPDHITKR